MERPHSRSTRAASSPRAWSWGARFAWAIPLENDLGEVVETGEPEGGLEDLGNAEDAVESKLRVESVLEVYAPVFSDSDKVIGAYEVYADATPLEESIADRRRELWIAIGGVFLLLWALLVVLAEAPRALCDARPTPCASAPLR